VVEEECVGVRNEGNLQVRKAVSNSPEKGKGGQGEGGKTHGGSDQCERNERVSHGADGAIGGEGAGVGRRAEEGVDGAGCCSERRRDGGRLEERAGEGGGHRVRVIVLLRVVEEEAEEGGRKGKQKTKHESGGREGVGPPKSREGRADFAQADRRHSSPTPSNHRFSRRSTPSKTARFDKEKEGKGVGESVADLLAVEEMALTISLDVVSEGEEMSNERTKREEKQKSE
jgi:hypothetical protein